MKKIVVLFKLKEKFAKYFQKESFTREEFRNFYSERFYALLPNSNINTLFIELIPFCTRTPQFLLFASTTK